ncbi:hypothetical protein FRB93_001726 [Tulasnella sp. JGI-2019a]|nr:hypothetical protein FRB93_001726 [Tulasnella sp. JGI-2019a]
MQRPPVTKDEELALRRLVTALAATETFYCGGTAQYAGASTPTMMYITDLGAKALALANLGDNDLETLHNDCKFAQDPGHTADGLHTRSLPRALPSESFGFNFNPLGGGIGVMAAISAFCKVRVEARVHKLYSFIYANGEHAKVPKDGSKDEGHLGTLLIGLSTLPGPDRILLHRDEACVDIDWNDARHRATGDMLVLPWTFFHSDIGSEIQIISPGHQLILAYDIYNSEVVQIPTIQAMDVQNTQFYRSFHDLLKDPQVLPNGGILAFGLTYGYPGSVRECEDTFGYMKTKPAVPRVSESDRIISMLKGSDAIMYYALKKSRLRVQVKAVYMECNYKEDQDEDMYEDEDESEGDMDDEDGTNGGEGVATKVTMT